MASGCDECIQTGQSGGPPAVGGIAGLLEADDTDATTVASGSNDDIGYIAALAGVVAATLIAGGWYARRRWLRYGFESPATAATDTLVR